MWSRRVFAHGVRSAAPRVSAVPRTAFRRYATPAEAKPPIELFGVDGVYASALVRIHTPNGPILKQPPQN